MNNEPEDLGKKLSGLAFRQVPAEWRSEILAAARKPASRDGEPPRSTFSLRHLLANLFWPYPAAWGGLAAAWVLVMCLGILERRPVQADAAVSASSNILLEQQPQTLWAQQRAEFETLPLHVMPPAPFPAPQSFQSLRRREAMV